MKKNYSYWFLIGICTLLSTLSTAQNVGINTITPSGKLHVKGAEDISQLIIDADTLQGNQNPLIKLRSGMGADLLWIHSDDSTNVFVGLKAGSVNVAGLEGIKNTFIGSRAGFANNDGTANTAIGYEALHANIIGSYNTAIGSMALQFNVEGGSNTSVGAESLSSNTDGISNSALGRLTLHFNTIGEGNTALGGAALYLNSSGNYNTSVGSSALYSNSTGYSNTAIGHNALLYELAGHHNIAMGQASGSAQGSPNVVNTISIGNHGYLNAATNQAFFGNLSTTWIGGNVTWSTYSDARVKTDVHEDVKGLDFITRLRPVTYRRSTKAMVAITCNAEVDDYPEKYDIEKIKFSGFLAQEVEMAAKEANYTFSGITSPETDHDLYTLSYEQFVVPLVKAVQEQQLIIESLQKEAIAMRAEIADQKTDHLRIENQQLQIDALLKQIEALENRIK